MSTVTGTKGNIVRYEIKGIVDTIRALRKKGIDIVNGVEVGLVQGVNLVENEVKESIAGNRVETRSVDTGEFINSINNDKVSKTHYKVFTPLDRAKFLEHGTIHIKKRNHFKNTRLRTSKDVKDVIEKETSKAIRK